jgi:hypothetical protein
VRSLILAVGLGAVLAACNPGPPVVVEEISVEPELVWSRALQGKRVAVEGYINFDDGPNGQAIAGGPQLRSSPDGGGEKLIDFAAEFGAGPNQIGSEKMRKDAMFKDAPKGVPEVVTFDTATMTYQDAQGAPHPIRERVRVIGRVSYAVSVEDDPRSPTGQRFRPILTHVVLEQAGR